MEIQRIGSIPDESDLAKYVSEGVIPVRFCYPQIGGDKWHELRRDESYTLGNRELKAFTESLTNVKGTIGNQPINIVHIGPGDGIELPILFRDFRLGKTTRYAGLDISKQMIHNTERLNSELFKDSPPVWYLTDVETPRNLELVCEDIKNKGIKRNLILLTNQGVILSNKRILKIVYDSMTPGDYLFITIEGDSRNKREEILETYKLPAVRSLLQVGLKRAGYNLSNGNFETSFNEAESQAEVFFRTKTGDEVLCLSSYKPTEEEFRKRLEKPGFHIDFLKFYEDVHTFGVLCTKGGQDVQSKL